MSQDGVVGWGLIWNWLNLKIWRVRSTHSSRRPFSVRGFSERVQWETTELLNSWNSWNSWICEIRSQKSGLYRSFPSQHRLLANCSRWLLMVPQVQLPGWNKKLLWHIKDKIWKKYFPIIPSHCQHSAHWPLQPLQQFLLRCMTSTSWSKP